MGLAPRKGSINIGAGARGLGFGLQEGGLSAGRHYPRRHRLDLAQYAGNPTRKTEIYVCAFKNWEKGHLRPQIAARCNCDVILLLELWHYPDFDS